MRKVEIVAFFITFQKFTWKSWSKARKMSDRVSSIRSEIWARNHSNTQQESRLLNGDIHSSFLSHVFLTTKSNWNHQTIRLLTRNSKRWAVGRPKVVIILFSHMSRVSIGSNVPSFQVSEVFHICVRRGRTRYWLSDRGLFPDRHKIIFSSLPCL